MILMFLLLAATTQAGEEPPAALLVVAAKLFQDGNYAGAADVFDRFAERGAANGEFYLNQGNAHFLAGDLPRAILAYRRAERWLPNDSRLRANLEDARSRVLDPPAAAAFDWPARLSRPRQARLGLIGYVLGWLALALWIWSRRRGWLILPLAFWAFAGILWLCHFLLERHDAGRPLGVVAFDGVTLRKGNGESYPAQQIRNVPLRLNRGVEVRVRATRPNGWAQIELGGGVAGWCPRSQLLLDREPE